MRLWVLTSDEEYVGSGFFQAVYTDKAVAELEALRLNEIEATHCKKYDRRQTTTYNAQEVEADRP